MVCDFCGYGFGCFFYDILNILYYGCFGEGVELKFGMIFMIEFMVNFGWLYVKVLSDGWMVVMWDWFLLV